VEALSCGFEGMPWIGPDNAARTICVMAWPHAWLPEVLAHLTMTQGLFPNAVLPDVWVSFLGAAWSLSTEWQFYLLALLLTNTSKRRLVTVLLALAAAGVLWRLAAPQPWLFSRAFLPNNAHYFALGVASVSLARRQPGALHRYCCVLGFTLAVCATQGSFGKLLPPLVWTLCLAAQMSPESPGLRPVHRLLRCRLARYFGAISYCLYLVNEPIHKVTSMVVSWVARGDPALYTTLWLPLAILLPIGVAAWLHVSLEMPALRLGRALAARAETGGAWFGGARLRVLGAARSWMPPPRRP
jgi:peptidoglycan/LPS O-acetylase OafA/YrhL